MPSTRKYTIIYRSEEAGLIKLCKMMFGRDGSYYITVPYHKQNRSLVWRQTINYADAPGFGSVGVLRLDEAEEVATLDDDDRRLKLAHHPDGFLQFSGQGVTSGRDPDGSPRGIGTHSWSLARPVAGPSFGITLLGIDGF